MLLWAWWGDSAAGTLKFLLEEWTVRAFSATIVEERQTFHINLKLFACCLVPLFSLSDLIPSIPGISHILIGFSHSPGFSCKAI